MMIRLFHKLMHILKLFSHIYTYDKYANPFPSQIHIINLYTNTKRIHKHQTQFFEESVPSILPLLKKAYKAWADWYHQPFHLIYPYQIFKNHTNLQVSKTGGHHSPGFRGKKHSIFYCCHSCLVTVQASHLTQQCSPVRLIWGETSPQNESLTCHHATLATH